MIPEKYVWLVWASAFLIPWLAAYLAFPPHRQSMIWASAFTTPFGLTEPVFVPGYWNPPSLFDLAQRSGFDIESLLFCFGVGGIGAVSYNILMQRRPMPVSGSARDSRRHRFHHWALSTPFVSFPLLYMLPWNPIYPSIVAMVLGAGATMLCRPDLIRKTWAGGLIFLAYYVIFLIGLEWTAPGYVARVWNLDALSGRMIGVVPIEELLFAVAFGAYWSGVYEHFNWQSVTVQRGQ